jgi:uncharacterized protein YdiU (UPF0061 family)
MIAHWMCAGFVHGVMNTDNMSVLGVTIDYGPYGWLEPYDPDWTPNTTDFGRRRYAFGQQPRVAMWNLMMLARALSPLVPDGEDLDRGLERYGSTLSDAYHEMMLKKLGLASLAPEETPQENDRSLIEDLSRSLADSEIDMTLFFRNLSHMATTLVTESRNEEIVFRKLIEATSYSAAKSDGHKNLLQWLHRYALRLREEPADAESIRGGMLSVNPKYVLRNYLAQRAIEAAESGDLSYLQTLMKVLKTPYAEQPEHDDLAAKRPDWARDKPGCATLSCSS